MFEKLKTYLKREILIRPSWRKKVTQVGSVSHRMGISFIIFSRRLVRFMNHHVTDSESDWFVYEQKTLHKKIKAVLKDQVEKYGSYSYFYGHPYQSLGILGVYGERSTEERFECYELRDIIKHDDRLLDIGCNCGFMAVYTAFRTGCRAHGIDINPYMTRIGELCADYLRLSDRVNLEAINIHDFKPDELYTVVFSFATHWTDDENYRVPLREHFERLAGYLDNGGLLVFESHANDVGDEEFYATIDSIGDIFSLQSKKDTDQATRHLYLFRKV